MNTSSIEKFTTELCNLADAFNARQPTEGAIRVWLSSVKGIEERFVFQALTLWPYTRTKFPTPADLRKFAQELWDEHQSRVNELNKKPMTQVAKESGLSTISLRASYRYQKYIESLKAKQHPMQHYLNLLNRISDGENLRQCQMDPLYTIYGNPIPKSAFEVAALHREEPPKWSYEDFLADEQKKHKEKTGVYAQKENQ